MLFLSSRIKVVKTRVWSTKSPMANSYMTNVLDIPVDHSLMTKMPHQETSFVVKPHLRRGDKRSFPVASGPDRLINKSTITTGTMSTRPIQPKGRRAMASKLQDVLSSSQRDAATSHSSRCSSARTTNGPERGRPSPGSNHITKHRPIQASQEAHPKESILQPRPLAEQETKASPVSTKTDTKTQETNKQGYEQQT